MPTLSVRFWRIGHLRLPDVTVNVRFSRIGHRSTGKRGTNPLAGAMRRHDPHQRHTGGRRNQTAYETCREIAKRSRESLFMQSFHGFQHHAGHRRKTTKEAQPHTAADDLTHPATKPRRGRHVFDQHRKQKTGNHIRNERAHNERRSANGRHQHVQNAPAADAEETTGEHHDIHHHVGERIKPRLHAFHRRKRNLRRILRRGSARRADARMSHFFDVDRLRSGIRFRARVHLHWAVLRLPFLRFHYAPLYWPCGGQRCSAQRPCNNELAAVAAFLTQTSLHVGSTRPP